MWYCDDSVCTPYTIRNNYNSTTNANNNNSKFIYIKRTSTNTADFLPNFFIPENAPFSSFWKQKKNWVDENVKNSYHDNTTLKENVAYMLFKIFKISRTKKCSFPLVTCASSHFCHRVRFPKVSNNRIYLKANQHTKITIFRNLSSMVLDDKRNTRLPHGLH